MIGNRRNGKISVPKRNDIVQWLGHSWYSIFIEIKCSSFRGVDFLYEPNVNYDVKKWRNGV